MSMLAVSLALLLYPHRVSAQSWRGTVNGVDIQIARRPQKRTNAFVVYANNSPVQLVCGVIDAATHDVLFCADDMKKYANHAKDLKLRVASFYNLRFSYREADYWCEASTEDSPLFCRVRIGQRDFSKAEHKLDKLKG
jgi:hypothetical protein